MSMTHEEQDTYRLWQKEILTDMKTDLGEVKQQTIRTNGRVTRLEKVCLAIGAAGLMYVAIKAPELFSVIKTLI